MSSKKRSMDSYLAEVFKQFIAIKDDDFKKSQEVFKSVFEQVKQKMGETCNYYKKYSSQIMYAGSVSDGIKVGRMDEFDMDIVIRLPINYQDIALENEEPGFVKLKITNTFDHLDKQPDWEKCHKVTRDWRDADKYFLQNKFRQWMHKNVQKALNLMEGKVDVNGDVYLLTYKESGPAYTLNIRNDVGTDKYALDVDLVPVIKFTYPRVPEGYRVIEGLQAKDWFLVPKPNKALTDNTLKNRCWRISFQEQERELIKDCQALKTTIRLVKKLRDALEMKYIASYYIKSLFLKKVHDMQDKTYWRNKLSLLFRAMVQELYDAISKKDIPFFWNYEHNLIGGMKPTLQKIYCDKLKDVLAAIDANDVEKVVGALLNAEELKEFKKSEFYQKQAELAPLVVQHNSSFSSESCSQPDSALSDQLKMLNSELDLLRGNSQNDKKFDELEDKMNRLADRLSLLESRMDKLEMMERKRTMDDIVLGANSISLNVGNLISMD
ncbi:cyclic GMP-AMP synthase-like receptor isoform X1 [Helicoverpa zea]|uniref:cyclic GMP-AMP synthase-like receptor isoform X1 n=2 Tax=Helicoverpa zea TaxID=7113 RepID=UPI001F55ADCB|nr:cyclic GMP-AMP synthase-like receptor isoform X1 [Helicoverpa zea]XP_047020661.1 cyclic GMP-AMP synthase-like receptor isoform X1 [Helicoverpa zea]